MIHFLFKLVQESDEDRQKKAKHRIAAKAVDAQKQTDDFKAPVTYAHRYYLSERNRTTRFSYCKQQICNSYFKGTKGGSCNSYKTADVYNERAMERRARYLKEIE